jgi:hypothetical protein
MGSVQPAFFGVRCAAPAQHLLQFALRALGQQPRRRPELFDRVV